ncbi:hypothetical protein HaLaN_29917 [Haematococcus lacustris]|uniref:Uncharacterized protein n=1 Tax=Haematococcus lacustris TaxID=44745 RepID=A0A6A0AE38_HAELA|nr:hypothetical protein HaLaN_29917 [Haematococcus lacustris]
MYGEAFTSQPWSSFRFLTELAVVAQLHVPCCRSVATVRAWQNIGMTGSMRPPYSSSVGRPPVHDRAKVPTTNPWPSNATGESRGAGERATASRGLGPFAAACRHLSRSHWQATTPGDMPQPITTQQQADQ